MVEHNGQAMGRIGVMDNRLYNDYRQANTAFFGFFEVFEDDQAAQALFDAAFEWAHSRGLDEIIGPRGLVGVEGGGALVEGFEYRPAMGIPYNPSYYDGLIQAAGFEKQSDFLSGYINDQQDLPEKVGLIAEKVKARYGFHVKSFASIAELRSWIPRVAEVHRDAFIHQHAYYPPSQEEIDLFAENILSIADPQLIKLVMKGDEVAGFIIAYQDISAALQQIRGKLWPLGWLRLLLERRTTRWVDINGLGLIPTYQGLGANAMLYAELRKTLKDYRFEHAEIVQVNEINFLSRSDMENLGVHWHKRHRHYRRTL
ncbi:MAG: hypothetical protein GYA17_10845 [Chloroflexi bacterium]|nr:hypothetical protein [Anaerolineaceae bacterium]NMB88849.1 hypothetical protein [Chloroflexota bacterium]